jgi:ribosomal protein L25, Ctc-form
MAKQKHVLNVVTRSELGKGAVNRLRKAGHIPAVIYSKGNTGKAIYLGAAEWEGLQKFELNLVALVEGDKETLALIKEVQNDFIRGKASHIDFMEVHRDQLITATVTLHPGHVPPIGLSQGGMLEQYVHEIEVECLPDALPESVEIDISKLALGQTMHVGELVLPEGVKAVSEADLVVFSVIDPSSIEEDLPAPAATDAAAEPEVIGEKEKAEKAAAKAADKGGKAAPAAEGKKK